MNILRVPRLIVIVLAAASLSHGLAQATSFLGFSEAIAAKSCVEPDHIESRDAWGRTPPAQRFSQPGAFPRCVSHIILGDANWYPFAVPV